MRRARSGRAGRGRACGGLGLLGCLSFHPRKIVTTGEGGAVTTNDAGIAEAARRLRNHGWQSLAPPDMPEPGLNYRLSDILCAVGLPQARRARRAARRAHAHRRGLRRAAAAICRCSCRRPTPATCTAGRPTCVQVDDRDRILAALRAEGIEAQIGTYALNLLGAYRDQGAFPGAARVFERALALPFHTRLSDGDLDFVAETLDKVVSSH